MTTGVIENRNRVVMDSMARISSGSNSEAPRRTKGTACPPRDIEAALSRAAWPSVEGAKDWPSFGEQRASLQSELPI